mmetsp:Transcript_19180/g.41847  ORF Transcript_19180/g.41847 Transcript_19180/m.41847 type:complete len:217 (-) Transcript_19180:652-1302(-)
MHNRVGPRLGRTKGAPGDSAGDVLVGAHGPGPLLGSTGTGPRSDSPGSAIASSERCCDTPSHSSRSSVQRLTFFPSSSCRCCDCHLGTDLQFLDPGRSHLRYHPNRSRSISNGAAPCHCRNGQCEKRSGGAPHSHCLRCRPGLGWQPVRLGNDQRCALSIEYIHGSSWRHMCPRWAPGLGKRCSTQRQFRTPRCHCIVEQRLDHRQRQHKRQPNMC